MLSRSTSALAAWRPSIRRQARLVELRFFAGLSVEEIAGVMDISTATVKREWASAKAWLHREMTGGKRSDSGSLAAG